MLLGVLLNDMLQQVATIVNSFLMIDTIYNVHTVLGLSPSWGTSRICRAWSPSEHQLTPSLSPIGARVRSHAIWRRLFIFLMTATHISPNVFSLRIFLSNIHVQLIHSHHSYLLYITFIQATIAFIYITYSCFHFPWYPWQAGCPRSFVSDTIKIRFLTAK